MDNPTPTMLGLMAKKGEDEKKVKLNFPQRNQPLWVYVVSTQTRLSATYTKTITMKSNELYGRTGPP